MHCNRKTSTAWLLPIIRALAASLICMCAGSAAAQDDAAQFENHVRPLLLAKCAGCHGEKKQENALRVDSREALLHGGQLGPAIVPGDAAASRLWQAVSRTGDLHMPPDEPLSAAEVQAIGQWINAGAAWPQTAPAAPSGDIDLAAAARSHWSFKPLNIGALLSAAPAAAGQTPVDTLLAGRWSQAGLTASPLADPATLLRRVTYDLTGLPPTADEVAAFLADPSEAAYRQSIERLLASESYGEHWGRHWLDVVRYADTAGETADYPAPLAYKYRNYVIRALNDDKPFDQFVREQVAGDILAQAGPRELYGEQVTATGFLAISRRFGFDSENYHHLTIQDTIDTLGQAFLGLSLGCARCHDHKFDPVTMRDYYALYGIFASTQYSFPGSEEKKRPRDLAPLVPPAEIQPLLDAHAAQLAALDQELAAIDKQKLEVIAASAAGATAKRRDGKLNPQKAVAELDRQRTLVVARRDEAKQLPAYDEAYAVCEGTPQNARIQLRGEPLRPGDETPRRWLELFGAATVPAEPAGSGRLHLAHWLTEQSQPLLARVIANRVWQHHFGRGLVDTPNDFGRRGRLPTHPQLLDYLAARLNANGWSLKSLHRELLLSQAYRRSASALPQDISADPDNLLYARFSRRPLSAEELRDTLLMQSGALEAAPTAGHPFPPPDQWNYSQHTPFLAEYPSTQRSVYLMVQRIKRHPYLALFDGPDPNASTAVRGRSYVPTQALYLANSQEIHEQAQRCAARLLADPRPATRLERLFLETLGRPPNSADRAEAEPFLSDYAAALGESSFDGDVELERWSALVRSLWRRTEFLFIE